MVFTRYGGNVEDRELVEEALDSYGVEGLGHI